MHTYTCLLKYILYKQLQLEKDTQNNFTTQLHTKQLNQRQQDSRVIVASSSYSLEHSGAQVASRNFLY